MGNSQSSSSSAYDESSDPCRPHLEAYLNCVKSHEKGLSEGADCSPETVEYKKCRANSKKNQPPESERKA